MTSTDIGNLEEIFVKIVEKDIDEIDKLSNDPLSSSVYLYFIARTGMMTRYVDNLIDWANGLVNEVLVLRQIGAYGDRDITSALLAHHSLLKLKKSKINVDINLLNGLLSQQLVRGRYFDNYTNTLVILMCLNRYRNKIDSFESCFANVSKSSDEKDILNDAKNLVFLGLLLEETSSVDKLKELCTFAITRINNNDVPYCDKIYYAWLLWNYRDYIDKLYLSKIRSFVSSTLEDIQWSLQSREDTVEVYGSDITGAFSKVQTSISLDLINSFLREPNLLDKIDSTVLLAGLKVDRYKQEVKSLKNILKLTGAAANHLIEAEKRLAKAEETIDDDPKNCIDLPGEALENLCKAFFQSQGLSIQNLSGLQLQDEMVKKWKELTKKDWTELRYQTGVRHVIRIWSLKKHDKFETSILEVSYLILLAWRGYSEILSLIDQCNTSKIMGP